MKTTTDSDVYYDPYDFEIDTDPYPIWQRLRDERPLYYNERYDFYALSRFDDVERCSVDWRTYSSVEGHDPRAHQERHGHPAGLDHLRGPARPRRPPRSALTRVHAEEDGRDRAEGPRVLRPEPRPARRMRAGSTSSATSVPQMPMRTIGMLLGIPEQDQESIREQIDEGLRLDGGDDAALTSTPRRPGRRPSRTYIDWRAEHPSDDLMTELLRAEFEDETGTRAPADPRRGAELRQSPRRRRQRDDDPTHRLDRQGARRASRPARARSSRTASLIPGTIEEVLRFEAPSPVQARYVMNDVEHYGEMVPAGSAILLFDCFGATATSASSPTVTGSTSTARSTTTSRSATASTSVSAPRWRGWRAGSRSTRCCSGSRPGRWTGTTPCKPARRLFEGGSGCRSTPGDDRHAPPARVGCRGRRKPERRGSRRVLRPRRHTHRRLLGSLPRAGPHAEPGPQCVRVDANRRGRGRRRPRAGGVRRPVEGRGRSLARTAPPKTSKRWASVCSVRRSSRCSIPRCASSFARTSGGGTPSCCPRRLRATRSSPWLASSGSTTCCATGSR